jgi:hypothetical protein
VTLKTQVLWFGCDCPLPTKGLFVGGLVLSVAMWDLVELSTGEAYWDVLRSLVALSSEGIKVVLL